MNPRCGALDLGCASRRILTRPRSSSGEASGFLDDDLNVSVAGGRCNRRRTKRVGGGLKPGWGVATASASFRKLTSSVPAAVAS
jgi:hypothetical protein